MIDPQATGRWMDMDALDAESVNVGFVRHGETGAPQGMAVLLAARGVQVTASMDLEEAERFTEGVNQVLAVLRGERAMPELQG